MKTIFKPMQLIYLIFLLFIHFQLFGQQYYSSEDVKKIISATASNYFPELNEPVTLEMEVKMPYDMKPNQGKIGFYIDPQDGYKILEGNLLNSNGFSKDEIIKMKVLVKFTERKFHNVRALINKNTFVILPLFVGGAYRESFEVIHIRKNIESLKKYIANLKKGDVVSSPSIHGEDPASVSTDHTFYFFNSYEDNRKEEAVKWNIQIFSELKKEYDSLKILSAQLFEKINTESNRENSQLHKSNSPKVGRVKKKREFR